MTVCLADASPLLLKVTRQGFPVDLLCRSGDSDEIDCGQLIQRGSERFSNDALHQVAIDAATDLFLADDHPQTRVIQRVRARQDRQGRGAEGLRITEHLSEVTLAQQTDGARESRLSGLRQRVGLGLWRGETAGLCGLRPCSCERESHGFSCDEYCSVEKFFS